MIKDKCHIYVEHYRKEKLMVHQVSIQLEEKE
jgi:hypothetical protein